ncbi:MAG: amino acid permease [Actinomycetales bacterium]
MTSTMASTPAPPPATAPAATGPVLQRNLKNRHIQLIAIGGAIGTGLFMGSGKTISLAGPSIILVYAIVGFMLFLVMRAMGELLLHNSNYHSFQDFAEDFLGGWARFFLGWTYWMSWVVTGMAEIIAVAGYWNFWVNPDDPGKVTATSALLALGVLGGLLVLNLLTVKLFGEMEFWFALIKIVAISALVVTGVWLVFTGFSWQYDGGQAPAQEVTASFAHLWDRGGFFPTGATGFLAAFQIAIFAFVGVELVGTMAAETENPHKTLPRAINAIPVRIMVFYVLALVVIVSVTPWDLVNPETSPFVFLFSLIGLVASASIMNFVVLSSASSSCNAGLFSTSRMLYGLSRNGQAPAGFARLSSQGVPVRALLLGVGFVACSVFLMFSESIMSAFTIVTTVASTLLIFVWSMILISYLAYRRKLPQAHAASAYPMPGGRAACYLVLTFFAGILVLLVSTPDTRLPLLMTPLWFAGLGVAWFAHSRRRATELNSLGS